MKVIFFTKYTRKGASSRLRTFQYLDFFESQGIECTVSPFFTDDYLDEVYRSKTHNKWQALGSFTRRLLALLSVYKYNKVVVEKELFPFFPSLFEWVLQVLGVKYIVDYDDAIWHNYDMHPNALLRTLLRNKIRKVMRFSETVVAGNDYIKEYAFQAGAKKIIVIPTVVDMDKYGAHKVGETDVFTIGWIGSPITFKYLPPLKPVFEALGEKYNVKVKLIGANQKLDLTHAEESIIEWKEEIEAEQIKSFDVGIMPLQDNIWERGKCGYKLIQYMGSSVPIIGTPIGVNSTIIADGVNGFKATELNEWKNKLEYMITHKEERMEMGKNARIFAERDFSLKVFQQIWMNILTGH